MGDNRHDHPSLPGRPLGDSVPGLCRVRHVSELEMCRVAVNHRGRTFWGHLRKAKKWELLSMTFLESNSHLSHRYRNGNKDIDVDK